MNQQKPWYLSKTIWGSLVAAITSMVGVMGLEIQTHDQELIADAILQTIAILGSIMAVIGRLDADTTIE